jgi:hypothetical protein
MAAVMSPVELEKILRRNALDMLGLADQPVKLPSGTS